MQKTKKKKVKMPVEFDRKWFKQDLQSLREQKQERARGPYGNDAYAAGWADALKYAMENIDKEYIIEVD